MATTSPDQSVATSSGLTITDVQTATTSQSAATITWTTSAPASSEVDYYEGDLTGTTTTMTATGAGSVTSHSVDLISLDPSQTYHYSVTSSDGAGDAATSSLQSFSTAPFHDPSLPTLTTLYQADAPAKVFGDVEANGSDFVVTEQNNTNTNERLLAIHPDGTMSVIATYAGQLRGLAVDGSNYFVTGYNPTDGNVLLQITPDGSISTIASHIGSGGALGDVTTLGSDYIVTDPSHHQLLRITAVGTVSVFVPAIWVKSLKTSGSNVIAAGANSSGQGQLWSITAGGTVSTIASESQPYLTSIYQSVALDGSSGFIVDAGGKTGIKKISSDGTVTATIPHQGERAESISLLTSGSDLVTISGSRLIELSQ